MEHVDTLIIGFGKAGKTLAGALAKRHQKVVLVEKSSLMYGGTCINIACIPTKALEVKARKAHTSPQEHYARSIAEKRELTARLRQKNYDKVAGTGAQIIDGTARFLDAGTVRVTLADGSTRDFTADHFVVNTGAVSIRPPVAGLENSKRVYTSTEMMELETLPEELVIVGAGFIALEFASIYTNFGSHVTILSRGSTFLPKADQEIAAAIRADLISRGVTILDEAQLLGGSEAERLTLRVSVAGREQTLTADGVLLAVGRKPATEGLGLEKAGVELDRRGAIVVNERLQSSNPKILAAGDVKGGEQFTYISLDDFRILHSQLTGDGSRTTQNRELVPHTVFLDPPYASIGLTEEQAREQDLDYRVSRLPVAGIPKALVLEKPVGLMKIILENGTEKILGAHFYAPESHEIIHIIMVAMKAGLPYTALRNMIFAHPTMAEALNDL